MSRKKKRKKSAIGRESLRDVQERAIPRKTQYVPGYAEPGDPRSQRRDKNRVDTTALEQVTKRASARNSAAGEHALNDVTVPADKVDFRQFVPWAVAICLVALYAFWPTLQWLELQWRNEADYSHGYIVIPLSIVLLWMRWESFPGVQKKVDWSGLWLILLAVAMRIAGRIAYMDFVDGWAIVPLVAGIAWLLFGWPCVKWAAPAILFLVMLVPLPFRVETMLSWKLQGIATTISTGMLRIFGLPAIAEGHTIWIGETQLMIEQACSGLRIFVGMIALAFFWAATVKRSWIDRLIIFAAAIPLALLVNALRITVTGILYGWFTSSESRHVIHDWSGYLMIPVAAAMLWGVKSIWEHLYRPIKVHNPADKLRDTELVES